MADKEGAVVMWVESGVARQVVEKALSTLFEEARAKAPSIIFFDELDGLAPARSAGRGGAGELAQHSVVATLLALCPAIAISGPIDRYMQCMGMVLDVAHRLRGALRRP